MGFLNSEIPKSPWVSNGFNLKWSNDWMVFWGYPNSWKHPYATLPGNDA